MRRTSMAGVLLSATVVFGFAPTAYPYDFTLGRIGSHHVIQGYPHYSLLVMRLSEGSRDYAEVSVSGLPQGATHDFPDARLFCCGARHGIGRLWEPNDTRFLIETTASTPPGKYDVVVKVRSRSVERMVSFALFVHPVPVLVQRSIARVPAIPEKAPWDFQMRTAYEQRCNLRHFTQMSIGWEADDWYYDGARVRYQIAEYTGDPKWWFACGDAISRWYIYQVTTNRLTGWRVFPHGLRIYYERTRDQAARDALRGLITRSAYGSNGGGVSAEFIRETAFMIQAYVNNERVGEPPFVYQTSVSRETISGLRRSVAYGIGQLDQYIDNGSSGESPAYHQPFMAGLMLEALIEYYEFERARGVTDARIPWIVRRTVDWLWQTAWKESDEAFYYDNKDFQPSPDLNLLIAPAYAWLWRQTGDAMYQERGDKIFAGGVRRGWVAGAKQFNQNYRWSIDYVRWRSEPARH